MLSIKGDYSLFDLDQQNTFWLFLTDSDLLDLILLNK